MIPAQLGARFIRAFGTADIGQDTQIGAYHITKHLSWLSQNLLHW